MIFVDIELSRRLERAEGLAGSQFVEARARISPQTNAEWIEVAGARAMFDGPRSPITQTFGLGLCQSMTAADLDRLEAFYKERGAPVNHEVSPLADKALLPLLQARGYRALELTSVMYLPLTNRPAPAPSRNQNIRARAIDESEADIWARTSVEGWKGLVEFDDLMMDLMRIVFGCRCCIPVNWLVVRTTNYPGSV
jgi:hypothetical protein